MNNNTPFSKNEQRVFASEKWMVWKGIRLPFLGCSFLKGEMLNFRSVFLESFTLAQTNSNFWPFYWAGSQKGKCHPPTVGFQGGAVRFREGDYEVVHFHERMKCRVFPEGL